MSESFFDEPEDQSLVKAEIVVNYFAVWSRIMAGQSDRIGYFDFYAGPGRYGTGEKSTPLLILEQAVAEPKIGARLVSLFNDADPEFAENLQREIDQLENIETLSHKPQIVSGEVDDDVARQFESVRMIPALSFIDPWGYKGLSLRLIRAVIKDWGCEAVFFFNYNRINLGVSNRLVDPHMAALFGDERLRRIQADLEGANPADREAILRRGLGDALQDHGAPYLIPFRFLRAGGRPSHYICFVSKHQLGYEIMKDIMAKRGVVDDDGVPKFEYQPPISGRQLPFDEPRPFTALAGDLMKLYAGRTMTVEQVFKRHNVGTPFLRPHYKRALRDLEAAGSICCDPRADARRKNTMGDKVRVTFSPCP